VVVAAAAGLVLIAIFDLGPPLAFNDDWDFAWNARHFWWPPREFPAGSALALVHVGFGWLVTLGHTDQRLLRLSELPFVVLAMASSGAIARRLGATLAWSWVAAAAPLACPVFTVDATSFMSDIPYVALLMAAAWGGVAWVGSGSRRGMAACVAFAFLAGLQRQVGLAIPVAMALALLLARPRPRLDWLALAAMWALAAVAEVGPLALHLVPPTQGNRLDAIARLNAGPRIADLLYLPGMVGLGLLPFGAGLWTAFGAGWKRRGQLVFTYLLLQGLLFAVGGLNIFPGNVFVPRSLNWTYLGLVLSKPQIFPIWAFIPLEAAAVAAVVGMIWRHRLWQPGSRQPASWLLLLLALTQFLPTLLVIYVGIDRYYLPVIAPLVPLAAVAASRTLRPGLALGYAALAIVAGLSFYAVGEQDYEAWQQARDQAARLAYQQVDPLQVNAGYEANAVYGEIPYYDRTGQDLSNLGVTGAYDFSLDGPQHPALRLEFAPYDDPRPGVSYTSLASGRVVIVPATPPP
jgi:hypothetical protein